MKLISMTDRIEQIENYLDITNRQKLELIIKSKNFLNQKLELWMFVPCDLDGNILYPEYVGGKEVIYDEHVHDAMMDRVKEYQEAKERILFEGDFTLEEIHNSYYLVKYNGNEFWVSWNGSKKIEDLICINYELILTPTAKKQIGL